MDARVGDLSNLYAQRFRASLLAVCAAEGAVVKRSLVHYWAHFHMGLDSESLGGCLFTAWVWLYVYTPAGYLGCKQAHKRASVAHVEGPAAHRNYRRPGKG